MIGFKFWQIFAFSLFKCASVCENVNRGDAAALLLMQIKSIRSDFQSKGIIR